jgi:hypothetical protein
MNRHRLQLEAALRAVAVTSPTSFAWFGRRSRPLPRAVAAELDPQSAREVLIDGLLRVLYGSFYTQGRPVPVGLNGAPGRTDPAFVEALSRANAGTGGRQDGWRVERVERGVAEVERLGLRARMPLAGCRRGELVSVDRPKESLDGCPGFYMALGDLEPGVGPDGIEERVYFNVRAEGVVTLVTACTRLLNQGRIPFDLKVIGHPGTAARCDAAVLYLERGGFRRAHELLRAIVTGCGPHVHGDPPALTRPLAPGVSVGEHAIGLGPSFGASRCRVLAEAIVAAHERGVTRLPDRMDAVARRFAERGLDVDALHLAPGSSEHYAL